MELKKEQRDVMVAAIKKFFKEERGQDLGDLASILILDFVTEKLGPEFYNMGVQDAYHYLSERNEEMLSLQR
jgi:uncharacterized protein (DUF2164 family)